MNDTINLIKTLSDAPGASGFEDCVLSIARDYIEGVGTIEEDCLRNLYIYRKENTGNKPVVMLDAHSDEVGFMIHSIKPDGTMRIVALGSWNRSALPSTKVLVRNAKGEYIPGVIGAKPVHFATAADRNLNVSDISSLIVDVGATSYEEAVKDYHIRIGEPVVPSSICEFDEKHGIFHGKAFDCRIGVAALLEALKRLQGQELSCDVVGVLSSQEEVGNRGSKVAVNRVSPAAAVVLEGAPADDTFTDSYAIQTAMKKGPMFRFMDISTICNPRFQRYVLDLAEEKSIPVQASVREGGGNNASVINTALMGVPAVVAGIPVRYIHSSNCLTALHDFEATVELVVELVKNLTPEQIAAF